MTETIKPTIEQRDRLGRLLKEGDCVAVAHRNALMVGTVKKVNPKTIKVAPLGRSRYPGGYNKYSHECVLLEGPEVTLYVLKQNIAA